MPADPFTLRQADQARTDFAIIEDELELEAIHKRLSPTSDAERGLARRDARDARRCGRGRDAVWGILPLVPL